MSWTLLFDTARPGWENMAIDSALLDLADREGAAFLRLYRWEPHCLSFGRHEPAARRYDRARIAELGLDCVRRPTGGRAVWHGRELTYSAAAPLRLFAGGGLREVYAALHSLLAAALRSLGAEAALAQAGSRSPHPAAGPCFQAPVGGEVLLEDRKVVGSAQLRQGSAFLQHGSLLLEDDQSLPRSLAGLADAEAGETPLSATLGRTVTYQEAASAVVSEAARRFPGLRRETALPHEVRSAAALHASRFQDPAWTWQR